MADPSAHDSGLRYVATCTTLGLVLGWLPWLLHGPVPEKFNPYFLNGPVMVWAFYSARMLIGFWIGISTFPSAWYVRGPLVGLLAILPLGFVSLATPHCGPD